MQLKSRRSSRSNPSTGGSLNVSSGVKSITTDAKETIEGVAVVASLPDRSSNPYLSLALSPDRKYAIVADKNTLQLIGIESSGLRSIRSVKIAQHFCSNTTTSNPPSSSNKNASRRYGDVRDAFQLGTPATSAAAAANVMTQLGNVGITKLAWSRTFDFRNTMTSTHGTPGTIAEKLSTVNLQQQQNKKNRLDESEEIDSFVAAAGSNGVIVIWSAMALLFSDPTKAPTNLSRGRSGTGLSSAQYHHQPEGVLSQHTRAVNSLDWHPKRAGLLLTASQDGTVKLWERRLLGNRVASTETDKPQPPRRPWYAIGGSRTGGGNAGDLVTQSQKISWNCKATFEPKSEAVRDIQWSPYLDDIFGLVTVSGSLILYSMYVSVRSMFKIAAHTGDATTLDWHPTRHFVIATGGSGDRTVKVWDLETALDMGKKDLPDHSSVNMNANTWNTVKSEVSTTSQSSSETDRSVASMVGYSYGAGYNTARSAAGMSTGGRLKSSSSAYSRYVLSISASVTQVRWRPPSNDFISVQSKVGDDSEGDDEVTVVDRHDAMLAVATARLTSAGGSGALSMWSFNRPFMALSIVEGHEEGAVADFEWLQMPIKIPKYPQGNIGGNPSGFHSEKRKKPETILSSVARQRNLTGGYTDLDESAANRSVARGGRKDSFGSEDSDIDDSNNGGVNVSSVSFVWQHVLSVGRDGKCILQSFARGERPISRVPSSCFAMANLSPFQPGFGSLQCFNVCQRVPNQAKDDFVLTALRQDSFTASAPGVFQEEDLQGHEISSPMDEVYAGQRLPASMPELVFSVVDRGNLDENGLPIDQDDETLCVAPEVVHLSRFARAYKMYRDEECSRRIDLCYHNGKVAEELNFNQVMKMWMTVASLLDGAGLDDLPSNSLEMPTNAFQFAILPTVKTLLLERAEAGDVQTCVVLCEVLQVVETDGRVRVPGLSSTLVREWYLSYVDLLHQMCLFSAAAYLIKNCSDEAVGALNQQSTTINEACPRCGKPLQQSTDSISTGNGVNQVVSSARKVCKNCRRKVGMCFVCHQPVQGMFVWCPGCGHGGHLEHALEWFGGGQGGKAVREVCPTGCGHRCNFLQTVSAFPRTDSFKGLPFADGSSVGTL